MAKLTNMGVYERYIYPALIILVVYLLFFSQPDVFNTRSWKELWNLGHVPVFTGLGFIIYRLYPSLQEKKLLRQLMILLLIGSIVGLSIEILQFLVGRNASVTDLLLDVIGISLALPLFSRQVKLLAIRSKIYIYSLGLLLVTLASWPFSTVLYDEARAWRQFPALSDFENRYELGRWSGNADRVLSDEVAYGGNRSLKVELVNKHYSGIELLYFPGDWTEYAMLQFQVYNPAQDVFPLTVSIYDGQHRKNKYSYYDRYTSVFKITPGWNNIQIPVALLKDAPKKRQMDISDIRGIRIFSVKPPKGRRFYIDSVQLIN